MIIDAVVLAGGSSRRMGTDKASLEVDGRPLLLRVTDALHSGGIRRIVWVGGHSRRLLATAVEAPWSDTVDAIDDDEAGAGPLGGILSATIRRGGGPLLAIPCDLPFITGADVEWLISVIADDPSRPLVGELGGDLRPDVAWWTADCLADAEDALRRGERSLRGAQQGEHWRTAPLRAGFRDADAPEDLPDSGTVAG